MYINHVLCVYTTLQSYTYNRIWQLTFLLGKSAERLPPSTPGLFQVFYPSPLKIPPPPQIIH